MPSNSAAAALLLLIFEAAQAFRAQTGFGAFEGAEMEAGDAEGRPGKYDRMCAKKVAGSHKEPDTFVEKTAGGIKNAVRWFNDADVKDLGRAIKNHGIREVVGLKCACVDESMILATRDGDLAQHKRVTFFDWQAPEDGRYKCMPESERLFREAKYNLDKAAAKAVEFPDDSEADAFVKLQLYGSALRFAAGALNGQEDPGLGFNEVQWEMNCGNRPNKQRELEAACRDARSAVDVRPLLPYANRISAMDALLAIMGVEAMRASGRIQEDRYKEAVALLTKTAELLRIKDSRTQSGSGESGGGPTADLLPELQRKREEYERARKRAQKRRGWRKFLPLSRKDKEARAERAVRKLQQVEENEERMRKAHYQNSLDLAKPVAEQAARLLLKLVVELQPDIDSNVPHWPQQRVEPRARGRAKSS